MKSIIITLIFNLLIVTVLTANTKIDSILSPLYQEIQKKEVYVEKKWERINLLTGLIETGPALDSLNYRYSIYSNLLDEYERFNYDSAFIYANKLIHTAYQLKNQEYIYGAKIKMSFVLLSSGMFRESLDTLLSLPFEQLSVELRRNYLTTLSRAWIDLADYVQDDYYSTLYNQNGKQALQQALSYTNAQSADYLYLQGLYHLRSGHMQQSKSYYENLFVNDKLTLNDKAVVASSLSYIYKELGENEKSIEYLVKAAISDLQSATKETVALTNLAEILYGLGYNEFSLACVNIALNDANFYGARHRKVQISNVLPIIESSLLNAKEKQNRMFKTSTAGLVIFVIILLVLSFIVSKQNNKLKRTKITLDQTVKNLRMSNMQLGEVNKIKEEYIGHFFGLVSNYIGRMELLKKNILRKITLRQINEIELTVQNIDLTSEREELFTSFDSIFMKLFPRFIDKYNSFFNPEDQIKIEDGMAFPPELRIYALKRLGINDNEKIAKFLDYSVTTIYTYKTKLKKKIANPNLNFESALMEIQME